MTDLYRLERTLVGERLTEVSRAQDATHVGVALMRRLADDRARETAALRAQGERARQRIQDLELNVGRAIHRVDQAESGAAQEKEAADQLREELTRVKAALRKLAEKNGVLVSEKKRMRDQLVGAHPLPPIHYRIELTRDGEAYEHLTYILDAYPDKAHTAEALAEARRHAARRGGWLRQLRLDTVAWRAIVQLPLAE